MRLSRLLLLVMVAVNLTLVCQGHEINGHREGLHIALLGEIDDAHDTHEPMPTHGTTSLPAPTTPDAGRSVIQVLPGAPELPTLITLPVALLAEEEHLPFTSLLALERQTSIFATRWILPEVPPPRALPI